MAQLFLRASYLVCGAVARRLGGCLRLIVSANLVRGPLHTRFTPVGLAILLVIMGMPTIVGIVYGVRSFRVGGTSVRNVFGILGIALLVMEILFLALFLRL